MRKKEVKKLIGKENWKQFYTWMRGQTVSFYPNGETDFYTNDVMAFKQRLDTGYDKQEDPFAWD